MQSRGPHQFRLIDALALIAILSLLAAVLLPSVNQSRGGRRTTCLSNIQQLCLAMLKYEQRHREYPGYVNAQTAVRFDGQSRATRPIGWAFSILPYLERNDIVDHYGKMGRTDDFDRPGSHSMPDQRVMILICPSDKRHETAIQSIENAPSAHLSYVVNCGLKDEDPPIIPSHGGKLVPRDQAANGVFHFRYPYRWATQGALFPKPYPTHRPADQFDQQTSEPTTKMRQSFISNHDGTSTTLMFSENADSGNWTNTLEHQIGFIWQAGIRGLQLAPVATSEEWLREPLKRINQEIGGIDREIDSAAGATYARPSSFHPGGVNVAFCDGHCSFLADTVDYKVYCQLMTPWGKATGPAGSKGIHQDGAPILFGAMKGDPRQEYATIRFEDGEF